MIRVENIEVFNIEGALRGMRNPLESWDQSDSYWEVNDEYIVGEKDLALALKLIKAGSDHSKFMRQILVSMDITAPLYWWKEMDQYRINCTTNSTSTMHTLHKKEITPELFSVEKLDGYYQILSYSPNEINEETEIWKQHPLYSLYSISNQGRVRRGIYVTTHDRTWKEKILKNIEHDDGYLVVNILLEDLTTRKIKCVHRLVAETFIENPNNLPEVNHKDGNKQNCLVENLEWVDRIDNEQHSYDIIKTSHHNYASRVKRSNSILKFTTIEKEEIKNKYKEGMSSRQLGKEYNVSHTCILDVVNDKYGNIIKNAYDIFVDYTQSLEDMRKQYLETKEKEYWDNLIQMLPSSFNQKRTWTGNYAVLSNIHHSRDHHKLSEWLNFCGVIESLPHSELITARRD